jgi:transcriptional regulator with XRE-family HTH domain
MLRKSRRTLAADIRTGREDAGLSVRRLAKAAGVSPTTVRALEADVVEPTLEVVARLSAALGMSMSVRLYPGSGPLVRDHLQLAMIGALLRILHPRWRARPEVPVHQPVRGVIDLVLDDVEARAVVACEAHSELRRLEQQVRWSKAKAEALAGAGDQGPGQARTVGRLLLLRSTERTRAVVAQFAAVVAAAYPARSPDAWSALTGDDPWPGDAVLWCRVEQGDAIVLAQPPRGIRVGR